MRRACSVAGQMKITNAYDLPEAIVRAARSDRYSRGRARMSVTQLIDSPRVQALRAKHRDDMVEDVTDRIWALLGTAVHHLLEMGAGDEHIVEERLYTTVLGCTISGGVDIQDLDGDKKGVIDYKVTSTWSLMFD